MTMHNLKNNNVSLLLDTGKGLEYNRKNSTVIPHVMRNPVILDSLFMDPPVKPEGDREKGTAYDTSLHCHSGPRAGIQRGDKLMPKAFQLVQSGRSMVEMLGTLAIISVLSVGGIMGYSYGMDKYRANQTINDIMLRSIDIVSSVNQSKIPDTTSWPTENPVGYPITFVNDIPNDRYGIQIQNVPSRVCKMVGDALKNMAIVYVGADDYIPNNENDPCELSDKNIMEFYFETLKCEPVCAVDEICLWGECVSNAAEITKWPSDISCIQNSDCKPCGYCGGDGICYPLNGQDCTINTPNDGMCHWGECLPKSGCDNENPCQGKAEYCASPNNNSLVAFQDGETGICIKANYREINVGSQTYYSSNTAMSWWDADAFCRALGFNGLVGIEDLVNRTGNVITSNTALGNAILNTNGISNYPYVWTNETFKVDNEGYASFINLASLLLSSHPKERYDLFAICK